MSFPNTFPSMFVGVPVEYDHHHRPVRSDEGGIFQISYSAGRHADSLRAFRQELTAVRMGIMTLGY